MTLVQNYDYEKFSLISIIENLKKTGARFEFCARGDLNIKLNALRQKNDFRMNNLLYGADSLNVVGTDIYILFPRLDYVNRIISTPIYFENYPHSDDYEKSKKLFASLKRKFSPNKERFSELWNRARGTKTRKELDGLVKDFDAVEAYRNSFKEKSVFQKVTERGKNFVKKFLD